LLSAKQVLDDLCRLQGDGLILTLRAGATLQPEVRRHQYLEVEAAILTGRYEDRSIMVFGAIVP
jgi:hypothetical protein